MENEISKTIISSAIEVHNTLGGPGLLESVYEHCLYHELMLRNLKVKRQVMVPVIYKNQIIKNPFYIDLLVEDKVIIEIKALEKETPVHKAQLLTYLRLTGLKLGLLMNFGLPTVKEGVQRVVNGLENNHSIIHINAKFPTLPMQQN